MQIIHGTQEVSFTLTASSVVLVLTADDGDLFKKIIALIDEVRVAGQQIRPEIVIAPPADKPSRYALSDRERQVATLVAMGRKNKLIAEEIGVCEQTVKNHLHNIFDKLNMTDRVELALYAVAQGWYVPTTIVHTTAVA